MEVCLKDQADPFLKFLPGAISRASPWTDAFDEAVRSLMLMLACREKHQGPNGDVKMEMKDGGTGAEEGLGAVCPSRMSSGIKYL